MIGLGTIINTAAIVIGGLLGYFFGRLLIERIQDTLNMACVSVSCLLELQVQCSICFQLVKKVCQVVEPC